MDELEDRLPPHLIAMLKGKGNGKRYTAGDVLIEEGEISDTLFILLSGRLNVFTSGAKGRELVYNVLEPGEFFGEMFLDGEPRSASVKAVQASECLAIPGSGLRTLMRAHPELAEYLVVKVISRLRHATRTIKSIAMDGVYKRTVALLDEVAVLDGTLRRIPRSMTQGEIASRIGATREMVNHVMRDLARGGFIQKTATHHIIICKALPRRW